MLAGWILLCILAVGLFVLWGIVLVFEGLKERDKYRAELRRTDEENPKGTE